jgi:tripartite-type tricarboxylate transporter receptor subunit TctC
MIESGFAGFDTANWSGLVAPSGTPREIIAKLNAEVEKALKRTDTLEKLAVDGSAPLGGSEKAFADYLKSEHSKWGKVIQDAKIKLE